MQICYDLPGIEWKNGKLTFEIVNAGLHCSFRISRQILPLLLTFGWNTFVLKATCKIYILIVSFCRNKNIELKTGKSKGSPNTSAQSLICVMHKKVISNIWSVLPQETIHAGTN
jgi:hypothetical protein